MLWFLLAGQQPILSVFLHKAVKVARADTEQNKYSWESKIFTEKNLKNGSKSPNFDHHKLEYFWELCSCQPLRLWPLYLGRNFFIKKWHEKWKSRLLFLCVRGKPFLSHHRKIQIGTNLKHYLTPRFSYKLFSRIALRKIEQKTLLWKSRESIFVFRR